MLEVCCCACSANFVATQSPFVFFFRLLNCTSRSLYQIEMNKIHILMSNGLLNLFSFDSAQYQFVEEERFNLLALKI